MRLININKKYKTDIMPSKKPSKKSKTDKKVEKKVEEPKVVEKPVPDAVPVKVEEPANTLMEYEAEITKLQTDLKSALQLIKDLVVHVNAFDKRLIVKRKWLIKRCVERFVALVRTRPSVDFLSPVQFPMNFVLF